jgi:hypothetical protein
MISTLAGSGRITAHLIRTINMPITPSPFTLECVKCAWSHTFAPRSDVLIPGLDMKSHCPRCGARELRRREATLVEQLSRKLKDVISR